jgi:hypothetical protein
MSREWHQNRKWWMAFHTHFLPQTTKGYGTADIHTHLQVYINWFFSNHSPHMMWEKSVLYHRSNVNIYTLLFVTCCQCNCKTGGQLYNMECETFHLKVVADCSITIHSKRFNGAQAGCTDVALQHSHTVYHTVQVTHGAALDEVVKAIWLDGRDD